MRNKPWKMKEGFAIGIGLIAVGVVLQLAVGCNGACCGAYDSYGSYHPES